MGNTEWKSNYWYGMAHIGIALLIAFVVGIEFGIFMLLTSIYMEIKI